MTKTEVVLPKVVVSQEQEARHEIDHEYRKGKRRNRILKISSSPGIDKSLSSKRNTI